MKEGSRATGKAKHPHDASRPESAAVRRALQDQDIEALNLALTPRQRTFCHEYIVDLNASAAAVRAGYATGASNRQAYVLMRHEGVRYLIDHLMVTREAKIVSVDPDYVLQKITSILNKETVRDGDALRACELLARHLGMLTDKQEVKMEADVQVRRDLEEEARNFITQLKDLQKRVDTDKTDKKDVTLLD